jgi:type III pantothenate kinase
MSRPTVSVLLVDIGNSRLKWAVWRDGRLTRPKALEHLSLDGPELGRRLADGMRVERIIVASVAGKRLERRFAAIARRVLGRAPRFIAVTRQAAGVTTRYTETWRLGVDRFMAAIAGHELAHSRPVCVVSAGTAITVDLVDAQGVHRGGAILPGPALMVESLLRRTEGIRRRARGGRIRRDLFARNTAGAIEQGARYAVAALVERAVAEARAALGANPLLVLTGGGARELGPLIRRRYLTVPDLVLRGIALHAGLPLRKR